MVTGRPPVSVVPGVGEVHLQLVILGDPLVEQALHVRVGHAQLLAADLRLVQVGPNLQGGYSQTSKAGTNNAEYTFRSCYRRHRFLGGNFHQEYNTKCATCLGVKCGQVSPGHWIEVFYWCQQES